MSHARACALLSLLFALACGSAQHPSERESLAGGAPIIEVPASLPAALLPRTRVATALDNPRGMHALSDGSLLVAVAGTGDPAAPLSGALLHLRDVNEDGDFDDEGERAKLLDGQPSKNILEIVRRDEVFGMAGIAAGDGRVLSSLAFFGGPSKIFEIDVAKGAVTEWATTHGNINDLAYDPSRKAWYGVSSTSDEVVHLVGGAGAERVVKFPPLASGQDSVPAYLRHDPLTGELLVSLFSGSPEGEEGGEGTELQPRAASIVRVHPESRRITPAITGLTVPTDFEIAADGTLYVLEFCDAFLDPIGRREELAVRTSHGGFRRFSGRLLRIERHSGAVSVVAAGLDAPTNLELAGSTLYIAQGMGTPGRPIPGPDGASQPLTGFIEKLALPGG